VCCSVLQCVAVCCSVLQCVAVCCSVLQCVAVCCSVLQCVVVCCSVLQWIAVCCRVLQCVAVRCSVSHEMATCGPQQTATHCNTLCSVLQCVAVRCRVLQCVAVCCSVSHEMATCGPQIVCCSYSQVSILQSVAVCGSLWQSVAVCCSLLQCILPFPKEPYMPYWYMHLTWHSCIGAAHTLGLIFGLLVSFAKEPYILYWWGLHMIWLYGVLGSFAKEPYVPVLSQKSPICRTDEDFTWYGIIWLYAVHRTSSAHIWSTSLICKRALLMRTWHHMAICGPQDIWCSCLVYSHLSQKSPICPTDEEFIWCAYI